MRKMLLVVCVIFLLGGIILGCSNQSTGNDKSTEEPKAQSSNTSSTEQGETEATVDLSEKLDMTWMVRAFQGGGWPEDHAMIQALNEKFNVNLTIQWVPAANYQEKLNVMAASNDFPDLFYVLSNEFNKWKTQGIFLDMQPLLPQYPNLAAIPEEPLKKLNPSGHTYGLPYYLTEARDSLSIREDWLTKLNLKTPTTLDELYDVAKAFATEDPDNNGQRDTVGISFYIDSATSRIMEAEHIMAGFGLGNQWFEQDGKLIPYQTQVEEWKGFLSYMHRAYTEGVLDKDFAINKIRAVLEKFEGNKIGISYLNPNQWDESINKVTQLDPNAVVTTFAPPQGATGLTGTWTLALVDKYVINNKIDAKKQQRILMMLDYFLSPEGSDFIKHGIEGVHYKKISDDQYEKLEAADKDRQNLLNNWVYRPFDPGIQMYKWEDPSKHAMIRSMFDVNEAHKWTNPGAGLESETMNRSGANIDMKFMEAVTKIIMGQQPVESIEKASEEWLANGGDKIIEEINASYNNTKN
jgi:putative aldouronate transport system substrate-binding protein